MIFLETARSGRGGAARVEGQVCVSSGKRSGCVVLLATSPRSPGSPPSQLGCPTNAAAAGQAGSAATRGSTLAVPAAAAARQRLPVPRAQPGLLVRPKRRGRPAPRCTWFALATRPQPLKLLHRPAKGVLAHDDARTTQGRRVASAASVLVLREARLLTKRGKWPGVAAAMAQAF